LGSIILPVPVPLNKSLLDDRFRGFSTPYLIGSKFENEAAVHRLQPLPDAASSATAFIWVVPGGPDGLWERASGPTALSLYAVAEDAGSCDRGDCEDAWMGVPFIVTTGRIGCGKTAMFDGSDTDLTAGDSNGVLSVSLSDLGLMGIVT
jgi:hypothetical protein